MPEITSPYTITSTDPSPNSLSIPSNVSVINIQAFGGGGGAGSQVAGSVPGGNGGIVTANFNVMPGDTFSIYIGGGGMYGGGFANPPSVNGGGINDAITSGAGNGGDNGTGGNPVTGAGGAGGSMTCVTVTRNGTESILILAGGGGGGGVTANAASSINGQNLNGVVTNTTIPLASFSGGTGTDAAVGFGAGGGGLEGGAVGSASNSSGSGGTSYINGTFANTTSTFVPTYSSVYGYGGFVSPNTFAYAISGGVNISWADTPSPPSGGNTPSGGNPVPSGGNAAPSGGGGSYDMVCFHKGTRILTEKGYKAVEQLQKGEKVMTKKGPVDIVEMVAFTSTMKKHPLYVLPKDTLAPGVPQEHLYMSNNHAFKHKGKWHHMKCSPLTKKVALEELEYYHIIVEDYFNTTIVAENVEVETCFKYKEDNVMMAWACKKTCCQPLKVVRELNPVVRVVAKKISLPEQETPVRATAVVVPKHALKQLDTVKLSQTNTIHIQTQMDTPFDPKRDTYQFKNQTKVSAPVSALKTVVGARQKSFTYSMLNPEVNANLLKKVNAFLNK